MISLVDGFSDEEIEKILTAIGMVIGQGDGNAFGLALRQAEERKGRDDRFEQKDPCPICGFTLRLDTFSVFMVPEALVRKYGVERKYVNFDKPPQFGWAMHQMCAFMCYRMEYDERVGKYVEPTGYCQVCGGEVDHSRTCEIGHLERQLAEARANTISEVITEIKINDELVTPGVTPEELVQRLNWRFKR